MIKEYQMGLCGVLFHGCVARRAPSLAGNDSYLVTIGLHHEHTFQSIIGIGEQLYFPQQLTSLIIEPELAGGASSQYQATIVIGKRDGRMPFIKEMGDLDRGISATLEAEAIANEPMAECSFSGVSYDCGCRSCCCRCC